jgi:hypothetical protein
MPVLLLAAAALVLYVWAGSSGGDSGGGSSVGSLLKYSLDDLKNLWISAGGDPVKADLAAAVAMAESSGNPSAFNGADPHGGSFGLWQINGAHGDAATFDPAGNAAAAVAISNNGANWNPWGAYTNGSYQDYYGGGDD